MSSLIEIIVPLIILAALMEYGAATLGMGYGTTLAPILLMIGYSPWIIVPVILFSQFFAGTLAALFHHVFKNMDLTDPHERTALRTFVVTGVGGVLVSILISVSIPAILVGMYIAVTVMLVGCFTLIYGGQISSFSRNRLFLLGSAAAFNKGMSGGGYGPITIAGQILCGIKPRAAVAITALVEGIICAVGVILYILLAVPMDIILLVGITVGAVAAAPFAALTTKKLKQEYIKKLVGATTFLIGLMTFLFLFLTSGVS